MVRVLLVAPDGWIADAAAGLDPLEYSTETVGFDDAVASVQKTGATRAIINLEGDPRRALQSAWELSGLQPTRPVLILAGSKAQEDTLKASQEIARGADAYFLKDSPADLVRAIATAQFAEPRRGRTGGAAFLVAFLAIALLAPALGRLNMAAGIGVGLTGSLWGTVLGLRARKRGSLFLKAYLAFPVAAGICLAYLAWLLVLR